MSTSHDHREPLDAEEQALAARLARIGPTDGPSPALDARILAAAHAAAATRPSPRRRHWAAWFSVPPALITGVGVAAAAVLALGLVWQLRPQTGVLMPRQESAAGEDEEIFIIAQPSSAAKPRFNNPPPIPQETAAAPASPRAQTAAANEQASTAMAASKRAAADLLQEPEAKAESATAAVAAELGDEKAAPASPAAPAAAAPMADAVASQGFVGEPPPAPTVAGRHATYTSAARATAERRERGPVPAAEAAGNAEADGSSLDRIVVTGSRLRRSDSAERRPLAQVAVSEDRHLPAAEWLERIRNRRDEGNLEGARESLREFRREHPRIRIPDDLRALQDRPQ